jgi:hypothetical protein
MRGVQFEPFWSSPFLYIVHEKYKMRVNPPKKMLFIINNDHFLLDGYDQTRAGERWGHPNS